MLKEGRQEYHIPYDFIYTKCLEQENPERQDTDREFQEVTAGFYCVSFCIDKKVLKLDSSNDYTILGGY